MIWTVVPVIPEFVSTVIRTGHQSPQGTGSSQQPHKQGSEYPLRPLMKPLREPTFLFERCVNAER